MKKVLDRMGAELEPLPSYYRCLGTFTSLLVVCSGDPCESNRKVISNILELSLEQDAMQTLPMGRLFQRQLPQRGSERKFPNVTHAKENKLVGDLTLLILYPKLKGHVYFKRVVAYTFIL